jgi:hypothetical protein
MDVFGQKKTGFFKSVLDFQRETNTMNLIIDIQYFPSIILYKSLYKFSNIVFDQYETYQKMGFRNRCQIAGAQGVVNLSVPLVQGRDQKTLVRDVRISYRQPWAAQHWKTIVSCYTAAFRLSGRLGPGLFRLVGPGAGAGDIRRIDGGVGEGLFARGGGGLAGRAEAEKSDRTGLRRGWGAGSVPAGV